MSESETGNEYRDSIVNGAESYLERIQGKTTTKIVITRKIHRCNTCRVNIESGEQAQRITEEIPNEYIPSGIQYKSKYYHTPECPPYIVKPHSIGKNNNNDYNIPNAIPDINLSELELINLSDIPNTI